MEIVTEHFYSNLKLLCQEYSQRVVAKKTNISTSSLTNYLSSKNQPSLNFILALKLAFNISIDDFLTKKLDIEKHQLNTMSSSKFLGNYIVYYYNSSPYKGKVGSYNTETLTYGVISVVENPASSHNCYGIFCNDRQTAKEYLNILDKEDGNAHNIRKFYKQFEDSYSGKWDFNLSQIFVSLKNINDQCLILLNNPPSSKKYIGGLGTSNSISKGREHVPCIQYIMLSKIDLKLPDGDLYNLLSLDIAEVNVKNEAEELLLLFKNLYEANNKNLLTDFQRRTIIEDSLKNIIENAIESNMFRFAKVSNIEDDGYFRLVKEEYGE